MLNNRCLKLGVFLILGLPSLAWAACDESLQFGAPSIGIMADTGYVQEENFGLYNWDEATQTWVLLHSGYDPDYENQSVWPGEYVVYPETSPTPGPGSGSTNLQAAPSVASLFCGGGSEEPKTLPKVVAQGIKPSSIGGAFLAIVYRVGSWFGLGSASVRTVKAPELPSNELDQVKCEMPPIQRENAATKVAALNNMRPSVAQTGRKLRIKWRTGTAETYVNFGLSGGFAWMKVVPGTCQDAN